MAWEIDPFHSLVEFSVNHFKISTVKGRFTDVHGTIDLNTQNLAASRVKAQIKTASVHTGVPQRDAHLRSADFFEVAKYPVITFESKETRLVSNNRCVLQGDLTFHGVTQRVPLYVTYTGRNQDPLTSAWRIGLFATTTIDRRNFGITYNQGNAGAVVIGYEVRIDISVEAIQME